MHINRNQEAFCGLTPDDRLAIGGVSFFEGVNGMRVHKKIMAAAAAVSLIAVPTLAQAAPSAAASKLSVQSAVARSGAPVSNVSAAEGRSGGLIIGALSLAAIIAAIIIAADGNKKAVSR